MSNRILVPENLKKALAYTPQIREICFPLFSKTKINYFNFSRKYNDGSNISLTSNADWTQAYYTQELFDPVDNAQYIEKLKKKEIDGGFRRFFRFEFTDCPAGKIARDEFGLETSLSMIMISDHYYDCYFFGAEAGQHIEELMTLYTQYPHIFSHFIFYFHESSRSIIETISVEKNRILIPQSENYPMYQRKSAIEPIEVDVDSIVNSMTTTKYRLVVKDKEIFLTLRETQCLSLWLRGNTLKKIANELALSNRTVETHLEKIKIKLKCSSKSEIINLLVGKFNDHSRQAIASNISLIEGLIWS